VSRRPDTLWHRIAAGILAAGIVLAIATLTVVPRVLDASRDTLRGHVVAMNDPVRLASFDAALAHEQQVSLAILASIVVVALVCFGYGLHLLGQRQNEM
jgi:hypothetical protein